MKTIRIQLFALLMIVSLGMMGCGDKQPATTEPTEKPAVDTTVTNLNADVETATITPPSSGKNGVLIHMTEGPQDRFKVCLALKVAEDMAAENEVLVYMDHRATEVAFKATKDFEWNPFPKYKAQIAKLKQMGVRLTVCRPCLDAFFAKAADVMPEVEVVNPADIANFTSGRVMTLDY